MMVCGGPFGKIEGKSRNAGVRSIFGSFGMEIGLRFGVFGIFHHNEGYCQVRMGCV